MISALITNIKGYATTLDLAATGGRNQIGGCLQGERAYLVGSCGDSSLISCSVTN
jgi:hypothetical protein